MENARRVRIEVIVGSPDEPVFHFTGGIDERIVDQTLKAFGLRYIPPEPFKLAKVVRVKCSNSGFPNLQGEGCLDYPEKCEGCKKNEMKHMFEAKEEEPRA